MIPGVTLEQLEAVAALAPARPVFHPARRAAGQSAADSGNLAYRVRRYLDPIPGAVSGDHGHDRTFRAACKLVLGFAMTPDTAYPYFAEWNAKCNPPWEEHLLWRKLHEADKQSGPRGYLLNKEAPPPGAARATAAGACLRNYRFEEVPDGDTMRRVRAGRRGQEIVDELLDYTGGWPRRVGKMLFARDRQGGITWIKSTSELFAWIDWQYGQDGGRGFDWAGGAGVPDPDGVPRSLPHPLRAVEPGRTLPPRAAHPRPLLPPPGTRHGHRRVGPRRTGPPVPPAHARGRGFDPPVLRHARLGRSPRKRPIFLFESASPPRPAAGGARGRRPSP
jgi:hypothetical protein